jgi:hypothetical protein
VEKDLARIAGFAALITETSELNGFFRNSERAFGRLHGTLDPAWHHEHRRP